ncbi:MCE family protein [Rhodococcus sp. NPDC127530]|uniref:MCE family protein n=1 Tax=unclassified Rhodococcus (in: high G+C Gram-positive bacteria) TaxID=192944 RepID=UPI003643EAAB
MKQLRLPRWSAAGLGFVGTAVILVSLVAVLAINGGMGSFGGRTYRAAFTEAGGIASGDSVIVSGVHAGKVDEVELMDTWVQVTFTIDNDSVELGDLTSAQIKAQNPLGRKALQVVPDGDEQLGANELIPLDRTTPPYDVAAALEDLTKNVSDIDTPRVAEYLDVLSQTFDDTTDEMRPFLDGMKRISATVGSRDQAVEDLLASTASVSGILASRDTQIQQLIGDGSTLISTLNEQRQALDQLFNNTSALSVQLKGTVTDNQEQLRPALDQLDGALALLQRNRESVAGTLTGGAGVLRALGEVLSAFPGFNLYIPNLAPTNLIPGLPELMTGGK